MGASWNGAVHDMHAGNAGPKGMLSLQEMNLCIQKKWCAVLSLPVLWFCNLFVLTKMLEEEVMFCKYLYNQNVRNLVGSIVYTYCDCNMFL